MRVLLACCLLQAAAPVWACAHAADAPCQHCCHDANAADDSDGPAPVCSHCAAHGQTWGVSVLPAGAAVADRAENWRPSREFAPPPYFPDSLFKPPISLPIA